MYETLRELAARPEPWSVSTVKELWTRPHLARQMLHYHLNQETDHSSRRFEEIDRIVAWLDEQFDFRGKRVIDLGCGPGLYSQRMAGCGARVTGVDFSSTSLEYARGQNPDGIDYLLADYLNDPLPDGFEVATLIYYDYCAMAPVDRHRLLNRIHALLAPGGRLVLDVYGPGAFDAVGEQIEIEDRLMNGFFSPQDYIGIHKTDVYEEERLSLDRFLIVEPTETWQIFNWSQYFSPETAADELAEAGFSISVMTGGLDGSALAPDSKTLGLIAEKT
ncbi:MAG: methyltransferase domain-containing protein [Xanthomonadales bacterium]|nr:methyltransferase domain-containing protein [Gammaproteobacteria bacterium]NNL04234.1 methyltransferase domain-containing protein [Xanthomonadales bacterium]